MTSAIALTIIILVIVFITVSIVAQYLPQNQGNFGEITGGILGKGKGHQKQQTLTTTTSTTTTTTLTTTTTIPTTTTTSTTTTSTKTTTTTVTTPTSSSTTSIVSSTTISYPPGVYNITIKAKGSPANGVWPTMILVLDKTINLNTWTVATSDYQYFSVLANIPDGTHEIGIAFTNDYYDPATNQDRNLNVQYIVINGLTKFSSDSGVIYDLPNGDFSTYFDGINTIPGQAQMSWNGALRFQNIQFPAGSPTISVNFANATGIDVMSIATQRQDYYPSDSLFINQTKNLGLKMIRLTSYDLPYPYGPCTQWNAATHSCSSYNWNVMDTQLKFVVNNLAAIPLIRVGTSEYLDWAPPGMPLNKTYSDVTFPAQNDYAQYFADIAKHITVDLGISPVYLEVINEPNIYSGTNGVKEYLDLYATTRTKTIAILNGTGKSVGKDALVGMNSISELVWGDGSGTPFFSYLINSSDYIDFGSVHFYAAWGNGMYPNNISNVKNVFYLPNDQNGYLTDASIISSTYGGTAIGAHSAISFSQMKSLWQKKWGVPLHLFNTEGNLNSAWANGTDFRQQNLLSAVVHAIMLKNYASNGFDYYTFYQQYSWDRNKPTVPYGGWGFGIMNSSSPYNPYAPYWTAYLWSNYFPNQSTIYSTIVNDFFHRVDAFSVSTSSSKNILLLNEVNGPINVTIQVNGFNPTSATLYVLDQNSYNQYYDSSCRCTKISKNGISTSQISASNSMTIPMNGYTVAVLVLK